MKSYKFDYSKLKGRMIEKFGSQSGFAKAIGHSDCYVSQRLIGACAFTQRIISDWAEALEISVGEIGIYFFTLLVDTTQPEEA